MRQPKSSGTTGELAAIRALTEAGLSWRWQVEIKTRFSRSIFRVDFVIKNPIHLGRDVTYEVQGGLHYRTWGGKPALSRMAKDEAKRNCLKGDGWPYVESTDVEIKKEPGKVIMRIQDALAHPDKYCELPATVRKELKWQAENL